MTINKKEILTLLEEGIFKTIMNTSHELNIDSYVVGGFLGAFVFNLIQEFFFSMGLTIQSNIVAISLIPYLLLLVIFYLTYKRI